MRRPDTRTNTPSTGLQESDLGSINYLAPMCRARAGERLHPQGDGMSPEAVTDLAAGRHRAGV
jgi:hypothetical protein